MISKFMFVSGQLEVLVEKDCTNLTKSRYSLNAAPLDQPVLLTALISSWGRPNYSSCIVHFLENTQNNATAWLEALQQLELQWYTGAPVYYDTFSSNMAYRTRHRYIDRQETDSTCDAVFCDKLRAAKNGSVPPHFTNNGVHFFNIHRNDVYLVACSIAEISPILVIEVLSRLYHVLKDFCGVVTERSIQANTLLIYELLDEILAEGYVQLASTDKLRPYILSEPVIVQREISPANEMSSRVFGIETKVLSPSAASKPVIQTSADLDTRRNELFVDVVEKMVCVVNADGTVARMEVNGSINMKNFLSGSPQIKVILNEDLVIADGKHKGYGNQVQIDSCTFHQCVKADDFASSRSLVMIPPVGEFCAMSYNVSGAIAVDQPFRLLSFIRDAEGSKDSMVTLRLRSDIPARTTAVNVAVRLQVPSTVSSVSSTFRSDGQSSEFKEAEQCVIWTIKKLPGKTEAVVEFRLICQTGRAINSQEVGPMALEFEISGYTSSGLQIRHIKTHGMDKIETRQQWIRHITVSDSCIYKT